MSTGVAKKIILLAALMAFSGCSTTSVNAPKYVAGKQIMSAEDAARMITVTVTRHSQNVDQDVVSIAESTPTLVADHSGH